MMRCHQMTDAKMSTMRTTIRIDDELYRRVKQRAAATGRTIGDVIADAVRLALDGVDSDQDVPVELPVFSGTGVLPGVDLASNAALREVMDQDVAVDALR